MAKFWIQYDAASGTYVPWEANTPPSPESVHRARFLSQFPAWIKYLSAMEGTEPYLEFPCWNGACSGVDHSFIYPARPGDTGENRHIGTVIQTAAFWNMLNWTPSEKWLNVTDDQLIIGEDIDDGAEPLTASDAYIETEFDDVQAGDIIHPTSAGIVLTLLWKLRRRIDLCAAVRCDLISPHHRLKGFSIPSNCQWITFVDTIVSGAPYINWAPGLPDKYVIGGAVYVQCRSNGPDGWWGMANFREARNIYVEYPREMADESVSAGILAQLLNPEPTYSYGINTDIAYEFLPPPGVTVEKYSSAPYVAQTVLINAGIEGDISLGTGNSCPAQPHIATVERIGFVSPFEKPYIDYLPLNSRFNDECAFSDLYNPA